MRRLVNVARWLARSQANGPGERFVLWVQGCSLACEGCWNPDTWSLEPRTLLSPEQLLAEVDRAGALEGITLSGGEPFAQAAALVPFVEGARRRGLSVLAFTGFELPELKGPAARTLLGLVDVLVAGRYRAAEQVHGVPLIGSRNQQVHHLSARYSVEDLGDTAICEAHVAADGSVLWTGFPGGMLG